MKQLYLKILKCFLPLLFIAYVGCISLFTHSHVVNGVTIVHSHPFKQGAEHTHTTAEFQLIHSLSHLQIADGAVACLFVVFCLVLLHRLFIHSFSVNYHNPVWGIVSLRAPPVTI